MFVDFFLNCQIASGNVIFVSRGEKRYKKDKVIKYDC